MKILFTTFQGGIAGSTYSILELATGLKSRGHEISFAGREEMPLFGLMAKARIECYPVRFSSYFDLKSARQLSQIAKSRGIQIINAQSGIDRTVAIWSKMFFKNPAKLVFTRRQQPIDEPWIKRKLHQGFSNGIICTSKAVYDDFVRKGYDASMIRIIPNGINQKLVNHTNLPLLPLFSNEGPVIGCVSRKKRQDLLLSCIGELPSHWNYLFVGVNEEDFSIPKSIKSRVRFTGRVARYEALCFYKQMSLNLLLTDSEGFGMTVLESMLLRTPVVASEAGGVREIIRDGENGFLVQNNRESLVKTLVNVMSIDKSTVIEQGFKTATEVFPIEKTVENHEIYFQSLL